MQRLKKPRICGRHIMRDNVEAEGGADPETLLTEGSVME
jgi:hypothetical protein